MDEKTLIEEKDKPLLYRAIRRAVKLFAPAFQVIGADSLPDEPCVIVGNHCQAYGPIAGELYMPGKHSTWCAGEMMHKEEVADYAYKDFWSGKPKSVRWVYRIISHMIPSLSEYLSTNSNAIAVYHDYRLRSTYRDSMTRLKQGANIIIFPECYDEHNNIVHAFHDKFIDLARFYYKKTGKELCFVPMYVAPYLKKVYLGKPIRYNADAPMDEERERICRGLMDAITEMAVSLPEHTVVPYPNIPKKDYPKNVPLEVYDE